MDAKAYERLINPLVKSWNELADDLLAPPEIPSHPLKLARFGFYGVRAAKNLALGQFRNYRRRALFAGLAAHSFLPLERMLT